MKRLALVCIIGIVTVLLAGAGSASAGGWAATTLDPLPAIEAGQTATIGFTIRQHGVTPVDLDGVEIVLLADGGSSQRFPARLDGPTGHYVVDVDVPAAGSYRWNVVQGWFGPQDLGTLVVGAGGVSAAPGSDPSWPDPVRYGLLAATLVSAAVFVTTLVGGRRRPQVSPG